VLEGLLLIRDDIWIILKLTAKVIVFSDVQISTVVFHGMNMAWKAEQTQCFTKFWL